MAGDGVGDPAGPLGRISAARVEADHPASAAAPTAGDVSDGRAGDPTTRHVRLEPSTRPGDGAAHAATPPSAWRRVVRRVLAVGWKAIDAVVTMMG